MRPQRIIHVSNFGYKAAKLYLHGVAPKLTNGWTRAGHHVINFSDRDVARWNSLFGHRKQGVGAANKALLDLCRSTRPDVLALGHADVIKPETVAAIRDSVPGLRVLQWNVDPIFDGAAPSSDNARRILSKQALVDATFISTAGPLLASFAKAGAVVGFLPNPVDASLERGRNFEREGLQNDLFFAVGRGDELRNHVGEDITPNALADRLAAAAPEVRLSLHGVNGRPTVAGPAYEDAILSCAGALNLSRRNDVCLYTSDRLAHVVGNGLLAHVDRATGYGALFSDDQFAFYATQAELIDNLARFKRDDQARRRVAEAGWKRYFELFDATIIAEYMLDTIFQTHDGSKYPWPTLCTSQPSPGQPVQQA